MHHRKFHFSAVNIFLFSFLLTMSSTDDIININDDDSSTDSEFVRNISSGVCRNVTGSISPSLQSVSISSEEIDDVVDIEDDAASVTPMEIPMKAISAVSDETVAEVELAETLPPLVRQGQFKTCLAISLVHCCNSVEDRCSLLLTNKSVLKSDPIKALALIYDNLSLRQKQDVKLTGTTTKMLYKFLGYRKDFFDDIFSFKFRKVPIVGIHNLLFSRRRLVNESFIIIGEHSRNAECINKVIRSIVDDPLVADPCYRTRINSIRNGVLAAKKVKVPLKSSSVHSVVVKFDGDGVPHLYDSGRRRRMKLFKDAQAKLNPSFNDVKGAVVKFCTSIVKVHSFHRVKLNFTD
jgi:hypothetical protein